jgi:hypothetical protein
MSGGVATSGREHWRAQNQHDHVKHQVRPFRAIADLGYVRGGAGGELAAHGRTNFATWLFHPAATGWYPSKGGLAVRPVPVLGEPWPGYRCAAVTLAAGPTR